MTAPLADLLAESVEELLAELRECGHGNSHFHPRDERCTAACPVWTCKAAEVALKRWRRERQT